MCIFRGAIVSASDLNVLSGHIHMNGRRAHDVTHGVRAIYWLTMKLGGVLIIRNRCEVVSTEIRIGLLVHSYKVKGKQLATAEVTLEWYIIMLVLN